MEAGAAAVEYLFHDGERWRREQAPIVPLGLGMFVTEYPFLRVNNEWRPGDPLYEVDWRELIFNFMPDKPQQPQLGPCTLTTPTFDDLLAMDHPALNLLSGPFDDDPRAFYDSLDTYTQAVLLNTTAAMADAGLDMSKAEFVGFYMSDKPGHLPYGLIVNGFSEADLDKAEIGSSIIMMGKGPFKVPAPTGRRSPGRITIGSLEVSHDNHFDVDLYNLKSNQKKHWGEYDYNKDTNHPTWPHDVARQLAARGVYSGVECK
jgi:hypothetical protein